jgi:nitrogen PTS system EIIA component
VTESVFYVNFKPAAWKEQSMISIAGICSPDRIAFLDAKDKNSAIKQLSAILGTSGAITEPSELECEMFERERIMSTGIGLGVAVPHVRLKNVTALTMALGVCRSGVEYDAFDGQKVRIIIMIAAPEGAHREYLSILAKIALLLKSETIRDKIVNTASPQEVYDILKGY